MTVTLRSEKGVALTFDELDNNFADYRAHRNKFDIPEDIPVGKALAWDGEKFIPFTIEEAVQASGDTSNNLQAVTDRGDTTTNVITVGGLLPNTSIFGVARKITASSDFDIYRLETAVLLDQQSTSGVGSGMRVRVIGDGSDTPVVELVTGGSGYSENDTAVFTWVGDGVTADVTVTVTRVFEDKPDIGSRDNPFGSIYLTGQTIFLGPDVELSEGEDDTTRLAVAASGIDINGVDFVTVVGNNFVLPATTVIGSSPVVTQVDIDAAIDGLIDSAPGTLDTLNELAAALGDDANFATNITSAVNRRFNLDTHTTDDVPEGSTNLYYTDERVADHIGLILQNGSNISITYDDEVGTITVDSIAGPTGYDLSVNNSDQLDEGITNLYYTDERVDDRVGQLIVGAGDISAVYDDENGTITISTVAGTQGYDLSSNTTDNLTEGGTNLYYTGERVDDRVNDLLVGGTNISLFYDDDNDTLTINADSTGGFDLSQNTTDDLPEGSNLYYTVGRFSSAFSQKSTTDLAEGTNLYYTEDRVNANIASKSTDSLVEGTNLYYTEARVDANFATKTTGDLTEGANLYFTNERVDDRVNDLLVAGDNITLTYDDVAGTLTITAVEDILANNTTTDLAEGTNLYYTEARVDANFATKTTDNLTEGANLYYTTARARGAISVSDQGGDGSLAYNDTTGVITFIGPSASEVRSHLSASGDLAYDAATGEFSVTTYKSADFDADFGSKTTDNLTEGSIRLYYTDARVQSYLTTNNYATVSNVSSAEGRANSYTDTAIANILDAAPETLDTLNELAAALGDDPTFATTVSNQLGLKFNTADFNTFWEGRWSLKTLDDLPEGTSPSSKQYFTDARARQAISVTGDLSYDAATGVISYTESDHYTSTDFATDLATKTTSDLAEGDNLYFTTARAQAAARGTFQVNGDISYDAQTGTFAVTTYKTSNFVNDFGLQTTDTLNEGSFNQYFTRERVFQSLAAGDNISLSQDSNGIIHVSATEDNLSNNTTTDLVEGDNLYFTTARARNAISVAGDLSYVDGVVSFTERTNQQVRNLFAAAGDLAYNSSTGTFSISAYSGFDSDFASKTTADLAEGTNLYYTDARVNAYLTTNSYATQTYVNNAVSNLVDTAPEALDTLNELAAALGDDPDFATTVSTQLGTKFNTADFNTTFDTRLNNKTTSNLAEGSNLYYTNERVDARIASIIPDFQAGETNLFYSDDRVANYITSIDTDSIAEGSNQYFTRQRVADTLVAGSNVTLTTEVDGTITISAVEDLLSNNTTTDLAEGDNLYFTQSRARYSISGSGDMTYDPATGVIGVTVPKDISDLNDSQNLLDHFSGDYNDLTSRPTIPSDVGNLTDVTGLLFDGNYQSLTNKPSQLSDFANDVGYVTSIDIPTNNNQLTNGSGYITADDVPTNLSSFVNDLGYASIFVGSTPPPSPSNGELWFESTSMKMFVYFIDEGTGLWVQVSG